MEPLKDNSCSNDDVKFENNSEKEINEGLQNGVLTDKMIEEEGKLEQEMNKEEEKLKKNFSKEEKKRLEEQCYKRLTLLLNRSSIYAKFMAEKVEQQIKKEEKQKVRKTKQKTETAVTELDLNVNMNSSQNDSNSAKRKNISASPTKKKQKSMVSVVDVYQKENMQNITCNEQKPKDSNESSQSQQQPVLFSGGIMRPYQMDGFEWLKVLFENGVNAILADEMGLGKTIQVIAFIAYLIEMGVPGPFFICVPLSTIPNWYSEFQRFTPDIPVIVYHGPEPERKDVRKKIEKKIKFKEFSCMPVVVTSYQIALRDEKKLADIEWKTMVIDEAHRIKNYECKLIHALKRYNTVHRLLLTGTPLQNNLAELWSLLNFIFPELFDDLKVFESWFDVTRIAEKQATEEIVALEQEKNIISTIHQILNPFLLRRTKADVELKLPPKKEIIVHAPLSSLQQEYYRLVLNRTIYKYFGISSTEDDIVEELDRSQRRTKKINYAELKITDSTTSHDCSFDIPSSSTYDADKLFSDVNVNLRNVSMCLRKICNHPYLISFPIDPGTCNYRIDEDLIKVSGKLSVLDVMLSELKKRNHKVIIFSQFVTMINILEQYCIFRNYNYSCLHGTLRLSERQEEIEQFKKNESTFIFLISTKAGGLGLNLPEADTVIIYDSDWNPQNDLQAQDRCHRIGQSKPVVVYRLVVPNTVDIKMVERAEAKKKLEKMILRKGYFNSKKPKNGLKKMLTKEELLELLETSDMDNLMKSTSFIPSQDELKQLLDRSDMVTKN